MRVFYSFILILFLLSGISQSSESIRFIDINFIVKNSEVGKSLNKIIESKKKTVENDIKNLSKKLEDQKKNCFSKENSKKGRI